MSYIIIHIYIYIYTHTHIHLTAQAVLALFGGRYAELPNILPEPFCDTPARTAVGHLYEEFTWLAETTPGQHVLNYIYIA